MGLFLELWLALGGKPGRAAVLTPFMRMHSFDRFRLRCNTDIFFRLSPWVAGISGGPNGAHSVALSGGYEDDVDLGYAL